MTENIVFTFDGGTIEQAAAMTFTGQDRVTGAAQEISLPDRVVVIQGRKKATLNGKMIAGLCNLYHGNSDFRVWADQCK